MFGCYNRFFVFCCIQSCPPCMQLAIMFDYVCKFVIAAFVGNNKLIHPPPAYVCSYLVLGKFSVFFQRTFWPYWIRSVINSISLKIKRHWASQHWSRVPLSIRRNNYNKKICKHSKWIMHVFHEFLLFIVWFVTCNIRQTVASASTGDLQEALLTRYVSHNLVNCRNKLYNKSTANRINGVRGLQLIDL